MFNHVLCYIILFYCDIKIYGKWLQSLETTKDSNNFTKQIRHKKQSKKADAAGHVVKPYVISIKYVLFRSGDFHVSQYFRFEAYISKRSAEFLDGGTLHYL